MYERLKMRIVIFVIAIYILITSSFTLHNHKRIYTNKQLTEMIDHDKYPEHTSFKVYSNENSSRPMCVGFAYTLVSIYKEAKFPAKILQNEGYFFKVRVWAWDSILDMECSKERIIMASAKYE